MALINCKECGKEISDQAKACPNCGCPIKKKGRGFAIASLILGILSCFYTYTFCMSVAMVKIFESMQTPRAMQETQSTQYIVLPLIIIVALLAITFGCTAHKKGCKLKKKNAGIIMGIISIVISVLITILF